MTETIIEALARQARERPSAIALTDGRLALSWQETKSWVDDAAGWLRSRGFERGAAVVGWLPNCFEWYLVRLACEQAACFWVPVPASQGPREMTSILERVRPRLVVAAERYKGEDLDAQARALCAQTGLPAMHVRVPHFGPLRLAPPEGASQTAPADGALRLHERAHALCTSGSEGTPKLAVYTLEAACLRAHAQASLLGLAGDDVILVLSAGTGPSRAAWLAAPVAGSCVGVLPRFGVDAALEALQSMRATVVCGTPSQLAILAPRLGEIDTSSVRIWYTAGSVMPPSLAEDLEARTRAVVVSTYGGADFGGWAAPSPLDAPAVRRHTVGRPRGGTEFRILDERGGDVAPGDIGELVGRGPCCAQPFDAGAPGNWRDGWFHTGDLASRDAEGNVVIRGRSKEVIVRGGDKVSPAEVETLLRTHPGVADAAVVAVSDPVLGERICACVVASSPCGAPELAHLRSHLRMLGLAAYKVPERLVVLEAMPTVGDKVDRRALAAIVAAIRD